MNTYLAGPSVPGFYGFAERDFGDPESPKPYCRVTPSCLGQAVLPFRCPRCDAVIDFSTEDRREAYRDKRPGQGNHFCPSCGLRFVLNKVCKPWSGSLKGGAAPARVECFSVAHDGAVSVVGALPMLWKKRVGKVVSGSDYEIGCDILGAVDEDDNTPDVDELTDLTKKQLTVSVLGLGTSLVALIITALG